MTVDRPMTFDEVYEDDSTRVEHDPWELPVPLSRGDSVPSFPADVLPGVYGDHAVALAEATQTALDLAGMLTLAALATAAGGRAVVEVRPGWREPLNLFVAGAQPPGSRKSAVFRAITSPLRTAEQAQVEASSSERFRAEAERKAAHAAAEKAQAEADRADEADKAAALQIAADMAQMAEAITVLSVPRVLADDATPEALVSLMADQGGRIAVLSAEGDVFDIMAGRYSSSGPNLAPYLKGHAGDTLRVDRKGRAAEYIDAPALTLGLAVQPDVLRTIATKPGFRGRGLLARFLYTLPPSNIGRRAINTAPVPQELTDAYRSSLGDLVSSLAEWSDPAVVVLTAAADGRLQQLERDLERRMGPGGDLASMADWAAKLAGATARIAGLIHLAGHPTNWARPIDVATVEAACRVADYAAHHAAAVFDLMGADDTLDDARLLARWARGRDAFTRRDAHRAHTSRFPKAADLDTALAILEDHGFTRRAPQPEPGSSGGRPPSPIYEVNPHA